VLIRALAALPHSSYALGLHQLTGVTYCVTPLLLYLASWKLSGAAGYSFAAALICSLFSPITLLVPDGVFHFSNLWTARRLYLIFDWDDLPHITSLTLLPVAVWSLRKALRSQNRLPYAICGIAMAGMMLANMFGMVLVAMTIVTVPLALEIRPRLTDFLKASAVALCAYIVICPWIPPSLIRTIRTNSILDTEAGKLSGTLLALGIAALVGLAINRLAARRIGNWAMRWLLLFGCIVMLIPVLDYYAGLHFVPQPNRYRIEADIALIWIAVFCLRPLIERCPKGARVVLILSFVMLAGNQIVTYRRYTKLLLGRIDVTRSIEYRTAKWLEQNLPGQRVMMAGSIASWGNAFANVPQISAQPYTTTPNWTAYVSTWVISSGENAGAQDAAVSILWLKAFGARAITVPGPQSPEYWKQFVNPRKFEGMLPVIWRDRDTSIYRVSDRPFSLAHVIRPDDIVRHKPVNGLDLGEVRRYVAAIEDPVRPPAALRWEGDNRAVIDARLQPGEIVSTQITYHPGWHARMNGIAAEIASDGIGLMTVAGAGCSGECRIVLEYNGGAELRACRAASAGISILLLFYFARFILPGPWSLDE
jgi:hypothetical protein